MRFHRLRRREFITLLGGAAAWPLAARSQQTMPIIAFFSMGSWDADTIRLTGFRRGLNETGYFDGQNVAIEYRGMEGQHGQLPAIIADVVRRQVAVIVTAGNTPAALAAKAATATIPIVFATSVDPVAAGLVASFNRPGANVTGLTAVSEDIVPKRLQLLRELIPSLATVAVLVNPANLTFPLPGRKSGEAQKSAGPLGLEIQFLNVTNEQEIDAAFERLPQLQAGALLVSNEAFFTNHREKLTELAAHYKMPAVYPWSVATVGAGGLMSYGFNFLDVYRQIGVYTGRILKGEKPADLPVTLPTKFELVINLKTAKALGLTVPLPLQVAADEVIE